MNRDWMPMAKCRGMDPELFFPTANGINGARQAERAKAICRTCPVIVECGQYREATQSSWGVWGGTVIRDLAYKPSIWAVERRHGTEAAAKTHRRRGEALCGPCRNAENLARQERAEKRRRVG